MNHRKILMLCLGVAVSVRTVSAQTIPRQRQLCESVHSLLQASYHDFSSMKRQVVRHRDGATEWIPSVNIEGSKDCEGQSDPQISSTVSCTMGESQSADEAMTAYRIMVTAMRSCLDSEFVFAEQQCGKASSRSTPIKEATFEIKGKADGPDGPAVRVSLTQFHRTHSGYELTVWVDAKDKE